MKWPREGKKLTPVERDHAIDAVIELIRDVDGILQRARVMPMSRTS